MNAARGASRRPRTSISATLATTNTTASDVVTPIGPSGIGLLGEKGKIAPLGQKRITSYADDGTVRVNVAFGTGEGPVTVQGYAAKAPPVTATTGAAGAVTYSATTQPFTVAVTAAGRAATIRITPWHTRRFPHNKTRATTVPLLVGVVGDRNR